MDSERVFVGSLNRLQLKGKIGVFGRSIGGITACHLASKFKDSVELLVIDRSLDELINIVEQKLRSTWLTCVLRIFTPGWICNNA